MKTRTSCLVFAFALLSPNASSQWTHTTGPCEGNVTRFAVSNANPFVETGSFGVFLSRNSGTSWTAASTDVTDTRILSLAVSGTNLVAGTNSDGVCRSSNSHIGRTSAVLTDSSAADIRPHLFLFPSMGHSEDTYVPSFGLAARSGVYFLELVLPATILPRDPWCACTTKSSEAREGTQERKQEQERSAFGPDQGSRENERTQSTNDVILTKFENRPDRPTGNAS